MNKASLQDLVSQGIDYAIQSGADQADALISYEQGFGVSARKGLLEEIEYHQEQGFSISIYQQQRTASVSTTELDKDAIKKAIDKVMSIIQYTHPDPYAGLPERDYLAFEYPDLDLYHQWDITPHQAGELAIEVDTIARDYDPRITDSEGSSVSSYSGLRVFANSEGFVGSYQTSRHTISCSVVAKEDGDMQRDYDYTTARDPNALQDASVVAKSAAKTTLTRLMPRQIKTQKAPVIFINHEAKQLLGAFVSAISGGNLYRKSSFLLDHLEKRIFPDFIHISQQPHLTGALGSAPFDHEGVKTASRDLIKDGILESYVLGSYSARRLGMHTTGNAGGVFNLCINHSDMNLKRMLKEMGTGLLVTEQIGHGLRIMTGDYSRGAAGFWVENGEIQYPVSEITIAGNLKDMFQQVVAVGNDIDTRGNVRTGSIWIEQMTIAGTDMAVP